MLLHRYLLKQFLSYVALCLGGTLFVFVIVDFVGNSKIWTSRPAQEVITSYLNYLPHIFYLILPIVLLLSSVFTIGSLSKHMELTAIKGAGISLFYLTLPILLFGVLAVGLSFWINDRVLPEANHKRFKKLR